MDPQEIEITVEDYCFCSCHAELLQTAINDILIPLGVNKLDPAERVSACAQCHRDHVDAETEAGWADDNSGWRK